MGHFFFHQIPTPPLGSLTVSPLPVSLRSKSIFKDIEACWHVLFCLLFIDDHHKYSWAWWCKQQAFAYFLLVFAVTFAKRLGLNGWCVNNQHSFTSNYPFSSNTFKRLEVSKYIFVQNQIPNVAFLTVPTAKKNDTMFNRTCWRVYVDWQGQILYDNNTTNLILTNFS